MFIFDTIDPYGIGFGERRRAMDVIDQMRAFAAVARAGSFTKAAKGAGRSVKAMSQAVALLEARLGVRLLHRTTRRVTLSDAGGAYLERCEALLDDFDAMEAELADRENALGGRIRLTAPVHLGQTRLAEALASFMARHPAVEIDLELSYRRVDLVAEGFDFAVRAGALQDSTLTARRLGSSPSVVCAAERYLQTHGRPDHPCDLAAHDCCLDTNAMQPDRWRFRDGDADITVRVAGRFRANAPAAAAVIAGAGLSLARLPATIAAADLRSGRLVPLLENFAPAPVDLFAVFPPGKRRSARVGALIDHLADRLGDP